MAMVRSNLGDLVSRAEDPEKMLNQVVFEMKTHLVTAKKQVCIAIADERRLRQTVELHANNAAGWERRAMLAISAGDDDLARAALARKGELDQLTAVYQEQWQGQKNAVDTLRAALRALSDKIEQAERQRRVLIARTVRARAQLSIAQTLSNLDSMSPLGTLQRMEDRVLQLEAEAESMAELSEAPGESLEAQFRALEAGSALDEELADLKRRMALGPGSSDQRALPA
jgi:phage shock protein A